MKKFAARDSEDVLQVGTFHYLMALPALLMGPAEPSVPFLFFSGLLPDPHNAQVLRLLFVLSHWHGLAKLRLHTDETIHILDMVTKDLGNCICSFASNTSPASATKELPREAAA